MAKKSNKLRGEDKENASEQINVRVTPDLLEKLDDFRVGQRELRGYIPFRTEIIKEAIEQYLEPKRVSKKKGN